MTTTRGAHPGLFVRVYQITVIPLPFLGITPQTISSLDDTSLPRALTAYRVDQVTFTVTWKATMTPHSMTPPGAAAFPGVVSGPQGRPNEEIVAVPR